MKFLDQILDLPPRYKDPAGKKGRVEQVFYKTKGIEEEEYDKYCWVYLPYDYDPNKQYEMVYLLHGMEDVCDNCFYKGGSPFDGGEPTWKKYLMDHMLQRNEALPFICAAVEWYPHNMVSSDRETAIKSVKNFPNELTKDIMPAVEAKYHTYADYNVDAKNLVDTRDHRAILGWSMGSATTWEVMLNTVEYFRYFNPESLAYNAFTREGNEVDHKKNVEELVNAIKAKGYTSKDFVCYMTTGSEDFARPGMDLMVEEMKNYPEVFDFTSEDPNTTYLLFEGGKHHTWFRRIYQYNAIRTFFKGEGEAEKV